MMTTRTHTAAEDGFTLVEVLVTIVIGMIVLAATLTMLASGFTSSAKVQDRHDTAGRARVSLNRASTLLQAQTCNGTTRPVVEATPTSVTFTATTGDVNGLPVQYRLFYDGTEKTFSLSTYTMGVPDPATGYQLPSAVPARTEQITDRVIPDGASTPVFRYFGTDDPKEIDEVQLGTDVAGITGADELKRVLSVQTTLRVLPTRTKTETDRTASVIRTTSYVGSNLEPTKLDKGPQC